ncbi:MAG: hypothetical protein J7K94_06495 [Dehalococcoidia bacterium]|nr:hypothetical protein [Dehalococcoidia bacterium]
MEDHEKQNLEEALAKTEMDAKVTLQVASSVKRALQNLSKAAREGNLHDMGTSLETTEKALAALRQQFSNAKEGWDFDEESYFANNLYAAELIAAGKEAGLRIFERDGQLYCYPALIRVSPSDRAVLIDKKRERHIRPSLLAARLKKLQQKPPSFKADAFLESLFKAYLKAIAISHNMKALQEEAIGPSILLVDIYDLLTMLPGQAREYSKQEFIHDIYLLHRSGKTCTRSGAEIGFSLFTGRGKASKVLTAIDEAGERKPYYAIYFTPAKKE